MTRLQHDQIKCPVCGSTTLVLIYEKLRSGESVDIWRCTHCTHVFYVPDASCDFLSFYKSDCQRKEWSPGDDEAAILKGLSDDERRFEYVRPLLQKDMVVLEIGCGYGHFLSMIGPYVSKAIGVECNTKRVQYARKHYGLEIIEGMFSSDCYEKSACDVVISFFSLEHICNLDSFFADVKRIIKVNGTVLIEVPNHEDLLNMTFKVKNYRDFYYQKAHVSYFTAQSLLYLLKLHYTKVHITGMQRYNVHNLLHWLHQKRPQIENPLDGLKRLPGLTGFADRGYKKVICKFLKCDTILAKGDCIR